MNKTTYIAQLPETTQNEILAKVQAHYENELCTEFTEEEKEIVLGSRLCDLEEIFNLIIINNAVNYIISLKETCQECGITVDAYELAEICNCDIVTILKNYEEICKQISKNQCVAEIYFTGDFEITFYTDYCPMVEK